MVTKKGFTLLELLIVVAVLAVLSAIVFSSFSAFRNSKVLDTAVEDVLTALSQARGDTLASKDGLQYGVHLQADKAVIYQGATYSSSDPNNQNVVLDGALEITSITLTGGGQNVLFDRLTGKTSQNGTFVIRVTNDTAKTRTITVNGTGVASSS